jgi:hypothetical protein
MRRAYPARGNRGESKTHGLPRRFVRRLRWRPSRDPAAVAASMLRRDINSITSSPRYGCRVKAGSRFARELYSAGAPRHVGSPSSRCPWRNSRRPSFCFDLAAHRVSPEDALTSAGVGTPPCASSAASAPNPNRFWVGESGSPNTGVINFVALISCPHNAGAIV